jgi:membrane associated rhomboid family serine protease
MATSLTKTARSVTRTARTQAITLGATVGALWTTFVVNAALGGSLLQFGVVPRTERGLLGVLFAPFLHGNLQHLMANTIPLLIFGWLVMLRDHRHFALVTLAGALGSGAASWLLGAPGSVHVGASGVVFGYFGFLLLAGWYARSVTSVALSVLVAVLWGGMIAGVLPGTPGVSWQGHLGGLLGGVLMARAFRQRG